MEDIVEKAKDQALHVAEKVDGFLPQLSPEVKQKIARFDLFTKVPISATEKRSSSGILFLLLMLLTGFMVFDEIAQYAGSEGFESSLSVDTRPIPEQHHINVDLDITFPGMKCSVFGFDVMDVTGELQLGAEKRFHRENTGRNGCRMYGSFEMHKVNGEFHIAFGRMSQEYRDTQTFLSATQKQAVGHVHLFSPSELHVFNASHTVNNLVFGYDSSSSVGRRFGFGRRHSLFRLPFFSGLNNMNHMYTDSQQGRTVYLLKVVPIEVHYSNGRVENRFEYTYSSQHIPITVGPRFSQPGVFFRYELSPYTVVKKEIAPKFSHTLVSCFSIVAGMLLLTRIISTYISNIVDFITCGRVKLPSDILQRPMGAAYAGSVQPTYTVPVPGFNPDFTPLPPQPQQQLQPQQSPQVQKPASASFLPFVGSGGDKSRHMD